jgi:hypothetical protein
VGVQNRDAVGRLSMSTPDETDMTLEDLKARLAQAEPVEIVDGPVTTDPSPWLQEVHTATRPRAFTRERRRTAAVDFRLSGAASS